MISENVFVENRSGLHARPASILVHMATKYACDIRIRKGEKVCSAKSILQVLKMGIAAGTEISVECDGEDEQEALDALITAIKGKLGETD